MSSLFGLFSCVSVLLMLIESSHGYSIENQRIIGGISADIAAAPYLVSIRYKKNESTPFTHRCSGTIISSSVVLTTAACVIGLQPNHLHIIAGTSYRSLDDGYIYLVDKYVMHPDFNIWYTDNDLAIVHLAFDLLESKPKIVATVEIASELPSAGSRGRIAGWGATLESHTYTEQLQLAAIEVVDVNKCRQSYGENRITEAMMCAGASVVGAGEDDRYIDACVGDAGGALVVNDSVVGLVSWGSGCGRKDFPGVYTNLLHFRQWIAEEILKF